MPATKRGVQKLRVKTVAGRAPAAAALRFNRFAVQGAALETSELMQRAVIARRCAFRAVAQAGADIGSRRAQSLAHAALREAKQVGDRSDVHIGRRNSEIRIDRPKTDLRNDGMR